MVSDAGVHMEGSFRHLDIDRHDCGGLVLTSDGHALSGQVYCSVTNRGFLCLNQMAEYDAIEDGVNVLPTAASLNVIVLVEVALQ
jgi:hypothetical protein